MTSLKRNGLMQPRHARYVALETTIGIAINTLLSMILAYALCEAHVPMPGDSRALLRDIGTQCFIVALACVLLPTLLTRRRCRVGTLQRLERRASWLDNLVLRAILIPVGTTAIAVALLHWAVLPQLAPASFAIGTFVTIKGTVGAVIAFAVTPIAVYMALGDAAPIGSRNEVPVQPEA